MSVAGESDEGDTESRQAETGAGDTESRQDESGADGRAEPARATRVATHRPDHLRLAGAGGLVAAGVGIAAREPALLLATLVTVGLMAARHRWQPPTPELAVERTVTPREPADGETVTVETTVTNAGEDRLHDCRIVDRPPAELAVTDGSPRLATALEPGESCTLVYEFEAEPGNHAFEGAHVVVSDPTGTREHEYELAATGRVACRYRPDRLELPVLGRLTTPYAGRLATESPGEGLEFHAVREYRSNDPLGRIDWNRFASSRELATLQFRTERSAAVVVLVDVRREAYTRSRPDEPHAARRGIDAASRLLVTLLEENHRAGIATLGPDVWLPPGNSSTHRTRALETLSTEPAFSSTPPADVYPVRLRTLGLLQRLAGPTQVVVCSPLVDDRVEVAIQLLETAGHEVTVLSPDPTRLEGRGDVVAALERDHRIDRIHGYGVPVVDWDVGTPLDVAVARTMEGWSA